MSNFIKPDHAQILLDLLLDSWIENEEDLQSFLSSSVKDETIIDDVSSCIRYKTIECRLSPDASMAVDNQGNYIDGATMYLLVPHGVRHKFSDKNITKLLLDLARNDIPPHWEYIITALKISTLVPGEETSQSGNLRGVTASKGSPQIHPVFGTLISSPQVKCDVFVIMPFAKEFAGVYDQIILPAIKPFNLIVKRGDDPVTGNISIINEIWALINSSRLVVADCTNLNPNVFWEIGLAHALGKNVILLTQEMGKQPFDLHVTRAIPYSMNIGELQSTITKISDAIRKLIN